jgi:two-component system, NtrC family, response regulator GlrR
MLPAVSERGTQDAPPLDVIVHETDRPHVRWSDASGKREVVVDRPLLVGGSSDADVVLDDPAVSRLHAELEPRKDGLWIRDLGSRNGVSIEDVLVGSARIPHKARVRLGRTDLVVTYRREKTNEELWPEEHFAGLVGRSTAMRRVFRQIDRVARTELTVFVRGETGTGKELVARAVHEMSPRKQGPFIVVDCGALPPHLVEAELFGHVRGAFTGAERTREGAVEAADGGTLFFDEIGELPLEVQPKLLRLLETREVRRVGETRARQVDVRFVSATHRDLRELVNRGEFREDLYFRLATATILVPPLRDRLEDLELLVERFAPGLDPIARGPLLRELATRPWPGNVREVRNVVERAVALGTSALTSTASRESAVPRRPDGSLDVSIDVPWKELRDTFVEDLERRYVSALLERHGRNVTAAANAAGLARTYLHKLIKKYDL